MPTAQMKRVGVVEKRHERELAEATDPSGSSQYFFPNKVLSARGKPGSLNGFYVSSPYW